MRIETIAIVVACLSLVVSLMQSVVPFVLRRVRERRAAEWRRRWDRIITDPKKYDGRKP